MEEKKNNDTTEEVQNTPEAPAEEASEKEAATAPAAPPVAALAMHQQRSIFNFRPFFRLSFTKRVMSKVLVNVTIGIGEVIHKQKACERLLSSGFISCFILNIKIYRFKISVILSLLIAHISMYSCGVKNAI